MFCSKCGNELTEGSAFCNKCGNPVNQSSAPVVGSAAFVGAAPGSAPAGAAAARKKPVLPIALAVIVVAIIGVAVATGGFGLLSSVSPKDTVEEYTWEELSTISSKIAKASDEAAAIEIAKKYNLVNEDGMLDGTQTKSVTLTDGTVTSVQIAGFLHDEKSDGSGKAGITFIFTDAIAEMYMNADGYNTGGWESSDMRSWLVSDGKALLPEELQDVIVAVDKSTNNVGHVEETDDASAVVTTTSDELWLFSYAELAGEVDESDFYYGYEYLAAIYNAEGPQYKLFSDCKVDSSDSNDILTKTYQGDSCRWWERSLEPYHFNLFLCVYFNGNPDDADGADYPYAIIPGFCI